MRRLPQSATTVGRGRRRRRTLAWIGAGLLLLALVELFVLLAVGRAIGPLWALLLVIAMGLLGLWLLRREGARSWRALRAALRAGEAPSRQIADAVLVLVGGVLLLLPGFVSDVVGLVLVLPFTRPAVRPLLEASVARRVFRDLGEVRASPSTSRRDSRRSSDEVVEGEIIDE